MSRITRGGERYWALRGIKAILPIDVEEGDTWIVTAQEIVRLKQKRKRNHGPDHG